MPVYQGRDSCMARREGLYVRRIKHPGVDTVDEAVALAYMCVRDLRRGYTYDNETCRKIRMTGELFKRRVKYIYTLAVKHGASARELQVIRRLVNYVLKHRRMPKTVAGRSVEAVKKRMLVRTR